MTYYDGGGDNGDDEDNYEVSDHASESVQNA